MAKRTKSARKAAKKSASKPSAPRQRTPARKGYKVWTEPEKAALTAGVAKYGPGQWKKILDDPAFGPRLTNRSNVDLKDKWRGASPTPTKKKTGTPVAVTKATGAKPSSAKKLAFTKSPTIGVRRSPSKARPSYTKTKPAPPPKRPSSARKAAPAKKPAAPAKKVSSPAPAKKSAPAKASSGGCVIM